ncbi:MAG TPA: glycoside hydrolase family 20 zincin-like fold domain-containing protein [Acidimicrobiales bacterium]|nr:glycoside hydrolase family 20 zincin-like fold domain-containing protein [Acidimicrobiales bacterium]
MGAGGSGADSLGVLFPRPQRLTVGGEGAPAGAPVRVVTAADLPAEGFRLTIGADGVTLEHRDDNGRRYGSALLDQVRAQSDGGRLPGLRVDDWPDFPVRGFMLDVSRDRVPTRGTLSRLVGLLALARFNQLQLYTEHTFAYRDHETVWRDASPITPDDVVWLDALCRDQGIELVPNQNCFGHMHRWLEHPEYRERAEAPDGFEIIPGIRRPAAVLAPTPDNAAFALDLFDELLPNFTSRQVNVGCDETFELGEGFSRDLVAARGREDLYLEHLLRIVGPLADRGYEVQFWADVLRRDPSLVKQLPSGVVPVAWTYEAPRRGGARGGSLPAPPPEIAAALARAGIEPDAHLGFAANTAPLAEAGVPFWVAPGTSGWMSLVGRIDNAVANMVDAAEVGLDRGAGGYLLTEWGDGGHMQPPSVGFGPIAFGGAVGWSLAANRDLDLAEVLDRHVFTDATGTLGRVLDTLGHAWRRTGQRGFNCSPLVPALAPDLVQLVMGRPDPALLAPLVEELDGALDDIAGSRPESTDGDVVRHELTTATRLARHGAYRLLRTAGAPAPSPAELRTDLAEAVDAYRESWLARARPGGLRESVGHLEATLVSYG